MVGEEHRRDPTASAEMGDNRSVVAFFIFWKYTERCRLKKTDRAKKSRFSIDFGKEKRYNKKCDFKMIVRKEEIMQLHFDFEKKIGKIKPMHGVGQPPLGVGDDGIDDSLFHYLTEANIPYSRLHDTYGHFAANLFVDIPNLFRNFDADENDPASYDFAFTDVLLSQMVKAGIEPYFRLGVTIENAHMIKAYRIFPPKDPEKWARICEHIVRHYNEGWANGFRFGITYWEIWNEPENEESIERNNSRSSA